MRSNMSQKAMRAFLAGLASSLILAGFCASARAMRRRWRCPPTSRTPPPSRDPRSARAPETPAPQNGAPDARAPRTRRGAVVRVVIAPDSFKGSIGASAAAAALAGGWRSVRPGDEVVCVPLADGGEGTLDVLAAAVNGTGARPVP